MPETSNAVDSEPGLVKRVGDSCRAMSGFRDRIKSAGLAPLRGTEAALIGYLRLAYQKRIGRGSDGSTQPNMVSTGGRKKARIACRWATPSAWHQRQSLVY